MLIQNPRIRTGIDKQNGGTSITKESPSSKKLVNLEISTDTSIAVYMMDKQQDKR